MSRLGLAVLALVSVTASSELALARGHRPIIQGAVEQVAPEPVSRATIEAIVAREAIANHLSPRVLAGIITVESAWNPWAMHYEPTYRHVRNVGAYAAASHISPDTERQLQRTAFGLTQLVGGTARALGFEGPLATLLDPAVNVHWGARYLGQLHERYPKERDTISAYNAGSIRVRGGRYSNQGYVDLVTHAMRRLPPAQPVLLLAPMAR